MSSELRQSTTVTWPFWWSGQQSTLAPAQLLLSKWPPHPISGSDQVSPALGTKQQASGLAGPWGGREGPPWRTAPPRPKSNRWSKTQAVHTPTGRLTTWKWTRETWVSDTTEDREATGASRRPRGGEGRGGQGDAPPAQGSPRRSFRTDSEATGKKTVALENNQQARFIQSRNS